MSSYQDKQKETKQKQDDLQWFSERMTKLVEELNGTREKRRAEFLRGCLRECISQHAALNDDTYTLAKDF